MSGGDPTVLELDRGARAPDAFAALIGGGLDMVAIAGVVSPGEAAALIAALPEPGLPVHPDGAAYAGVRQFGMMIAPTGIAPRGPDPAAYRAACDALDRALGAGLLAVRARVLDALGALAGVPAEVPDGYGFASIRRMPAGCGAPAHRDSPPEAPVYDGLRALCDLAVQVSWYVQLAVPLAGGSLRIYPELADGALPRRADGWPDDDALDGRFAAHRYAPGVGTMLVHPGSARWHRVAPVRGPEPRITLGGFCAWSRAHDRVWSWA